MEVYKYELGVIDSQVIFLPKGAQILTVQMQRDIPCLWALVDPNAPMAKRGIAIHGTGHRVFPDGKYIGTFQMRGGALVFHVFDHGEKE